MNNNKKSKINKKHNKNVNNKLSEEIFGKIIGNFSKSISKKIEIIDKKDDNNKKNIYENQIIKGLKEKIKIQNEEFKKMGWNNNEILSQNREIQKIKNIPLKATKINNIIKKNHTNIKNLMINEKLDKIIRTHKVEISFTKKHLKKKHKEKMKIKDLLLNKKVKKNKKTYLSYISSKKKLLKNKINSSHNKIKLRNNDNLDKTINSKKDNTKNFSGKYNFNHLNKIITFLNNDTSLLKKRNKIRNNLKNFKKTSSNIDKNNSFEDFLKSNIDFDDDFKNYEFIRKLGDGCITKVDLYKNKISQKQFAFKFFEKKFLWNQDKFLYLKV